MPFTTAERIYLGTQSLGRLATITPGGKPLIAPVGFQLNDDGTIDIGGPNPESQRYRNVQSNPNVTFAVDDMTPDEPGAVKPGWGRGVIIRGLADVLTVETPPVAPEWFSNKIIRIRPVRIHSWHIDPDKPEGEVRVVG